MQPTIEDAVTVPVSTLSGVSTEFRASAPVVRELRQVRDHLFTSPLEEHERVRGTVHAVVVKDGVEVAAMCWSFAAATDIPFAEVPAANRCPECTKAMEKRAGG